MKRIAMVLMAAAFAAADAAAQAADSLPVMAHRRLTGPRVGALIVPRPEAVINQDVSGVLVLFGWQREHFVKPIDNGPSLLVQSQTWVAGVERRKVLIGFSAAVGLRTAGGFEVTLGPSMSSFGVGLAGSVGQLLRWGSVGIPVKLSAGQAEEGMWVSMSVGYAIRTR